MTVYYLHRHGGRPVPRGHWAATDEPAPPVEAAIEAVARARAAAPTVTALAAVLGVSRETASRWQALPPAEQLRRILDREEPMRIDRALIEARADAIAAAVAAYEALRAQCGA